MIFFEIFSSQRNLIHGVMEKKEGSVGSFFDSKSKNNILKAVKKAGAKKAKINNLIFSEQIHGVNVYFCPPLCGGQVISRTDALVSKTPSQILVVKTADCVPLLIYSPKEKKVAIIHAGREGAIKGIIKNTLKKFSRPDLLLVGLGPHIRKDCYPLRGEAKKYSRNKNLKKYIEERNNKLYFDLTELVKDKLLKLGVREENIEDCGICTFCESDRFFSSRWSEKEKLPRRKRLCFGSFIGLR